MTELELQQKFLTLTPDQKSIVLKYSYKHSLFHTCKYLLNMQDVNERTHMEMITALEEPTKRKLIVMPRGSLKSSVGVVGYSIWLLLNNPNLRILIDSAVYTNSKNFIREIRAHLESDKLVSLFGEFKTQNWSEGELTINQRTKVLKEASITASGVGASKVGQHYDVVLHDDLNVDKNSGSTELCQKVLDHYKLNISIAEPDAIIAVIGTRYSAQDVIEYILRNEIGIEMLPEWMRASVS